MSEQSPGLRRLALGAHLWVVFDQQTLAATDNPVLNQGACAAIA
ncbi:MAG: hypothetical protein R2932_07290 [Caldilineaceae bacterium]